MRRQGYEQIDGDQVVGHRRKWDGKLTSCPTPVRVVAILLVALAVGCGLIIPIVVLFSGATTLPNLIIAQNMLIHMTRMEKFGPRVPWIGYNQSVDYVWTEVSENTNFKLSRHYFEYDTYNLETEGTLEIVAPSPHSFASSDFDQALNSGAGTVEGPVVSVGTACDATKINGFAKNSIALIARGDCDFTVKVKNVLDKNASGVIVYNYDNGEGPAYFYATDSKPVAAPVFGVSYSAGVAMLLGKARVKMVGGAFVDKTMTTQNLCAETPGGDEKSVIMVGAHLDTVPAGPGINDNGSGSAAILELAKAVSATYPNPVNKLRFCWWAAEEVGLLGSIDYVNKLKTAGKEKDVKLYLNFDMLGSQNYISFAFDGSTAPANVRNSSETITNLFISEFGKIGKKYRLEPFADTLDMANTDYGAFLFAGIPCGGLHSGAAEIKTMAERTDFGGWANAMADSCYHKSCDTVDNVDYNELQQNGRLAASVLSDLINKPDLDAYLQSPDDLDVKRQARDGVQEERQVCMSSHVDDELVCKKSTAKKSRIPRM